MNIGFIGVGHMGKGMAINILRSGNQLSVIANRNRAPIDELVSLGAIEAQSLEMLAGWADVVILCVSGTPAAQSVIANLLEHLKPGTIIIDTTTNEPSGSREMADTLARHKLTYIEAPVTGGVKQAEQGTLGAIVGCDVDSDFERAKPILQLFCERVEYFGDVGTAAKAKLISNFLALGTATLVIEAFKQARSFGIDWTKLFELAQLGSGNSSGLKRIIGSAIDGDYRGYVFSVENTLKDFTYICQLGEQSGSTPELATIMKARFEQAVADGHGNRMLSELLDPSIDG